MSIYIYGLLPTIQMNGTPFYSVKGIDNLKTCTEIVGEVTAVFCQIREEEFAESVLKEKMDNPKWVHKQAIHHHETVVTYSKNYLFLPSTFCTIYSSIEKLREDLMQKQFSIISLFEQLKEFFKQLEQHSRVIQSMKDDLKRLPPGKQFFMKKKQGQLLEKEAQSELLLLSNNLEQILLTSTIGNKTRENWSRNATGRNADMIYNSTSLVSKENREKFEVLIKEFIQMYEEKGIFVEVTGPWPFYHFANLDESAV